MSSTFRLNVGAVIADDAGRVLIFERADHAGAWQFPQGGVSNGEDPSHAVRREIQEETGIEPARLDLVATHPVWLGYELPSAMQSTKTGRGQVQKWFLFRLEDGVAPQFSDSDVEFVNYEWVSLDEAVARVVDFKRPVYQSVAATFGPLLRADAKVLTDGGREYVLAEFGHVTSSFLSNEEMGERRVVGFVTFIALLATAVGLVAENVPDADQDDTAWIAVAATVAALAFGLLTFRRILKRNVETTRLLTDAQKLRQTLAGSDPVAVAVIPFRGAKRREFKWTNGGLAETVAVLDSLLVAGGTTLAATALDLPALATAGLAVAVAVVTSIAHYQLASRFYANRLRPTTERNRS